MDTREEKQPRGLKIRLYGIVQGVGFRPFVVKLAFSLGLTGQVKNSGGLVDLTACGTAAQLDAFIKRLFEEKPANALIVHHETQDIPYARYDSFTVEPSGEAEGPVFVSPDLCVCDACLEEFFSERDERFAHPFISCMACGPRYSIIEDAPYDRNTTTMRDFDMCEACGTQYTNRKDRRYHAQTISCHNCGPFLIYKNNAGSETTHEAAFEDAVKTLRAGGVVAVKGIGGYHLCCDPFNQKAVLRLREVKNRELKPFAVMFANTDAVRGYAHISPQEEALLCSVARPVVLLKQKKNHLAPAVCGESRLLGAFLPYTPLQVMLMQSAGPLVMTSANVSEEPIIKDDELMLQWPGPDGVLYNTRRIAARADDSVVKVTAGYTQMIRRSRGYVPLPVILPECRGTVFAAGGQLKSAFCLASERFAYMGPHIGDLDNDSCIAAYRESREQLQALLRLSPELAVCDLHPGYVSTALAEETALPLLRVQHHHAHIASVMAEHGLDEPVIGVAFDGTGRGCDNTVWGGEFLVCRSNRFERAGHLKPICFLGGDEGMKDAAKSAMCYLHDAGLDAFIRDERWPLIRAALNNGVNTHGNSGMGRLFDAASAVLGICAYNRYEGECAVLLENLAMQALEQGIEPAALAFAVSNIDGILVADAAPVISVLAQGGPSLEALALGFHMSVANMAVDICARLREQTGINNTALSGGVFQNAVLLEDMTDKLTAKGFAVYMNESVPPNDGGISLGQAQIGLWHLNGKEYKECV